MYLKSIEIQGFKSFANKAVLQFHEGVTGIVGPNGSGKSNVADAVRWVLGEQKIKQLRGASMQDVIFAGTEIRKPQGFAFVAITLDNSDRVLPVEYAEVTVSRRLYRSGESEYMINGQQVRLRDVQELFYDTGIGREGYSIIGQGQIDAILSGKPEERRGLFDEAAGIVKFKRRKQIAERKLEAEQANLTRIRDVLSELSRQVGPLQKQAETARVYLRLRDELKRYDLNLFIRETERILSALKQAEENQAIVSASLADAKAEAERLKAEYERLSEELRAADTRLTGERERAQKAELLLQSLQGQIDVAQAEARAERAAAERAAERIRTLSGQIEEKKQAALVQLASLNALSGELKLVQEKQRRELLEMKSNLADGGVPEDELGKIGEQIAAFSKRLAAVLGLSAAELSEALKEAERRQTAAKEADAENGYREPEWLGAIRQKQSGLTELKERETRVRHWLNHATESYNSMTLSLKALNRKIAEAQQAYHTTATKLDALKNLAERYEGYGQSVRSVMQQRARMQGIHGVVADLIQTEKRYETAVETALGGALQNIVTDTEATAKSLIEYLKRGRLGRATFLPLNAVRAREQKEYRAAVSEPGAVGLASDIVRTEQRYRGLAEYLLGRTLVADNMDHAVLIARKYRYTLRIVTLDGELLAPGGSISGGAYKNSSNLMGRVREMEELAAGKEAALRDIDALNAKVVEAEREIAEKSGEIDELNEALREISLEKNTLSLGILSEMKLQYSGLSQKTAFIAETVERLSAELADADADYGKAQEERRESMRRIAEKEREIAARRADLARIGEEISSARGAIEEETGKRERLDASQTAFFAKRDESAGEILRLEKELLRIAGIREQEQQQLDRQTEYVWTEYELTLAGARAFYEEEIGAAAALRQRVSELKTQIRALGPVNVQAVDDYREIGARYEFMSAQHEDLVASEAAVRSVIEELDAGMQKQFRERFGRIQAEFDRVFGELFGGGRGTLELLTEDGTDALEAGIAINAQPPGKKLQNMMQLSGGEKALTAIALLFAIQNLKPSPFCLLDEIEAALDDSNVGRFTRYLHKLTRHTQFIVITHRRGTMEAADRLYGVTMQEKGVTALVSVDLVADEIGS